MEEYPSLKSEFYGKVLKRAIVTVGSWDPFLSIHRHLLLEQSHEAKSRQLSSVIVILDPNPATFIKRDKVWPVFDDVAARRDFATSCGIDGILQINFRPSDLELGVDHLIDALENYITMEEIWLGASQSLGRADRGNNQHIESLAKKKGFKMKRLPKTQVEHLSEQVRRSLAVGDINTASRVAGRSPQWGRPIDDEIRLAWRPGTYLTQEISGFNPSSLHVDSSPKYKIKLKSVAEGTSVGKWPGARKRLAFISGPNDQGWRVNNGRETLALSPIELERSKIVRRALADPRFRNLLIKDPQIALADENVSSEVIDDLRKSLGYQKSRAS